MRRHVVLVVALAALCRLTHELAFTLAVVPAICALSDRERRADWFRATAAVTVGLVAGQVWLLALHWLAPTSGDTMVRRFFLWQVLNLFERPGDRQFGIPLVAMLLTWILAPRRVWAGSVAALSVAAMTVSFSIARAVTTAPFSLALVRQVLEDGSRYPLDMFWHLAATTPVTLWMAIVALMLRVNGAGGEWRPAERGLHGLWLGWVVWFGVIESGITTNYLLLPVSFMVIAVAVDAHALVMEGRLTRNPDGPKSLRRAPRRHALAALAAVAAVVAIDQWRGNALDVARPTIVAEGIEAVRNNLQPADRVVCTDELGCLMLVGRIDRWLALDDYVRERFIVHASSGRATGVYTGVPATMHVADLLALDADGSRPNRIVIVDIFKEYPIGNSRSWLPRAIAQAGLHSTPLLETPQVRVVEVSYPAALAGSPSTVRAPSAASSHPSARDRHAGS